MTMELWVIVAAGSCLTGALAALAVLILGVHAEVKRLVRTAEAAQQALAANLRHMSPSGPAAPPAVTPAPPAAMKALEAEPIAPPLARLAEAVAEPVPPPVPADEAPAEPLGATELPAAPASELLVTGATDLPEWNPDRRLLVTRLLGRGKNAEQIAAALRIPLREVDEFLEANRLMPVKKK